MLTVSNFFNRVNFTGNKPVQAKQCGSTPKLKPDISKDTVSFGKTLTPIEDFQFSVLTSIFKDVRANRVNNTGMEMLSRKLEGQDITVLDYVAEKACIDSDLSMSEKLKVLQERLIKDRDDNKKFDNEHPFQRKDKLIDKYVNYATEGLSMTK